MNKWLVAIAFSVLLLVPVGTQSVFANPGNTVVEFSGPGLVPNTSNYLISDPDGIERIDIVSGGFFALGCPTTPVLLTRPNPSLPDSIIVEDCEPDGDVTTWELTTTGVTCVEGSCLAKAIGGEILPIDTTALLLAGVQSISMWMIPVVAAGIGIGVFVIKRRK